MIKAIGMCHFTILLSQLVKSFLTILGLLINESFEGKIKPNESNELAEAVCLLTTNYAICSGKEKFIPQHKSNVSPLLISCLKCTGVHSFPHAHDLSQQFVSYYIGYHIYGHFD